MRIRFAPTALVVMALLAPAAAGALVPRERLATTGSEEAMVRSEPGSWLAAAFHWFVALWDEDNGSIIP